MARMEPEFRRKYDFFADIARAPERIRDGSIRSWVQKQEEKDRVGEGEYWGQFLDFAHVLAPNHPMLRKRRASREAQAIVDTIRSRKSFRKNVLAGAVKHHFDMQVQKTFTDKRAGRIQAMVGYLYENRQKIRRDALLGFADKWNHGKPKRSRVTYATLKDDLIALSYAFLPVGNRETTPEQVIASRRGDFVRALAMKHRGLVDYNKGVEVCKAFTKHSIASDMERVKREVLLLPEGLAKGLEGEHRELAAVLEDVYRLRASEPGVHPATASSSVWKEVGWPLHDVAPKVNHLVYAMFDLAERRQAEKKPRLIDYELPLDPNRGDLLEHLRVKYGIMPQQKKESKKAYDLRKREKAAEELGKVWTIHKQHAMAVLSYEKARHALKGKKEYHEEIAWGHPTKFDSPKESKARLKKAKRGKESEAGEHLNDADFMWDLFKKMKRAYKFKVAGRD